MAEKKNWFLREQFCFVDIVLIVVTLNLVDWILSHLHWS